MLFTTPGVGQPVDPGGVGVGEGVGDGVGVGVNLGVGVGIGVRVGVGVNVGIGVGVAAGGEKKTLKTKPPPLITGRFCTSILLPPEQSFLDPSVLHFQVQPGGKFSTSNLGLPIRQSYPLSVVVLKKICPASFLGTSYQPLFSQHVP